MQFKKPVISGLLALSLLANLLMPAFAYNSTGSTTDRTTGSDTAQDAYTEYQETTNTSSETQVYATRSSTFTVLVPKTIILSGSTGLGQYVVGAKGDVLTEDSITIEPDSYELTLYRVDDHAKETPAAVTQGTTSVTGADIEKANGAYATMNGSIQANGLKAGSWSTTMRFNITLNDSQLKTFVITAENKADIGFTDTTTNLDIPSTFVDSSGEEREVVGIDDNAFYDSNNLEKVTIPNSVESIGNEAFAECDNLGRVEVADEVKEIGNNAFGGVDKVVYNGTAEGSPWGAGNVYETVDSIPVHVHVLTHVPAIASTPEKEGNIEYWHCEGCDGYYSDANGTNEITMDSVSIPKVEAEPFEITQANREKIGFKGTRNEKLVIPATFYDEADGKWYKVTVIGQAAFAYKSDLAEVTIPDTVVEIGDCAFKDCTGLTHLKIPDSVTTIWTNSFDNVYHIIYHGPATYAAWKPYWGAESMN